MQHFILSWKFLKESELQQLAWNHLSEIGFKDFMEICKNYTNERYSFLVNDTTLPSDNSLQFLKNL